MLCTAIYLSWTGECRFKIVLCGTRVRFVCSSPTDVGMCGEEMYVEIPVFLYYAQNNLQKNKTQSIHIITKHPKRCREEAISVL